MLNTTSKLPKVIFCCLTSLWLVSCTTLQPTPPEKPAVKLTWEERQKQLAQLTHWQLKGSIGIRTGQTGQSAQFAWQQQAQEYTLDLIAPLGAGSAVVSGTPQQAILQLSTGEHYTATNATDLLYQYTGWYLPTNYFVYWIRGLPAPISPTITQFDTQNRLTRLQQDGWQIDYTRYQTIHGIELPARMNLVYGNLRIRVVVKDWKIA